MCINDLIDGEKLSVDELGVPLIGQAGVVHVISRQRPGVESITSG